MKYIFLDESGELGFKESSSNYFIITLLSCDEGEIYALRRIMKRVRERLLKKKDKRRPELKGNNSSDKIRMDVLGRFAKTKSEVFVVVLEKSKVYEYLKDKKDKLYNYLSNLILNECSFDTAKVCLVVDKSKLNRSLREDFNNYIKNEISKKSSSCNLLIKHENSQNYGCLQVLDFVSWAIFRSYEYGDLKFIDTIKNKIVIRKEVFQKEASGP
ncbi:MAG: hypothetical protein UR15_C0001G0013 [Parcubacteria group bacterium GW2011_GWA2_31_28]|nr:MAG: hypothetical protein UR15_C0001G0013 [Parcubacteria group bacterium GW2011_GWA2_31_28]